MSSPLTVREQTGVAFGTSGVTQTIAATITTKADTGYLVKATVLAVQTDDYSQVGSYFLVGLFKNDGSVLSQVGATTNLSTLESNVAWAVDFATSGQDIQIKVTGAAATNISWLVDADVKRLQSYLANSAIIG